MTGFEPGDVVICVRAFFHNAKPHERAHLVNIAPHHARQCIHCADIAIGAVVHQARRGLQAPQHAVQQVEPGGIGVQRCALGKFDIPA